MFQEINCILNENFVEDELNIKDLIKYCELYYMTIKKEIYFLKNITNIQVDEIIALCFLKDNVIYNIAVKTNYQNKKNGYKLLKAVIKITKNLSLKVRSKNMNAIKLYEKVGFVKTTIEPNFYSYSSNNDDAINMKLI